MLRDRASATPSICDESLSRNPRMEPLRDTVEGVRERDCELRRGSFQGEVPLMGDGRGVMSPMAINCGEDSTEAGDSELPLGREPANRPRKLGVLWGRLPDETLW